MVCGVLRIGSVNFGDESRSRATTWTDSLAMRISTTAAKGALKRKPSAVPTSSLSSACYAVNRPDTPGEVIPRTRSAGNVTVTPLADWYAAITVSRGPSGMS